MDIVTLIITLIFIFILSWHFITHLVYNHQNLPPSPFSLPIIGHLHLIHDPLHETLTRISNRVGPVSLLRFGHQKILHVTSASAAEDCLIQNGVVFANRPRPFTGEIFGYGFETLIWSQYGNSWRNLRRISTIQILSPNRLHLSSGIRYDEVKSLIRWTLRETENQTVKIGSALFDMTHGVMMKVLAKERYEGEESKRFREVMSEVMRTEGKSTIVDVFPWMKVLGFKGRLKKKFRALAEEKENLHDKLMEKHRRKLEEEEIFDLGILSGRRKTLIEVLLLMQRDEPDVYTDDMIKGLFQVLLLAGTDTTAGTIEWALTLLLNNPNLLKKAQNEMDLQIGHHRLVDESDLAHLPFLRCVIYETLRLYPPAPMLIPHYTFHKCTIGGYTVPRDTMLLVNIWAIHRDPNHWAEPETFRPERFEGFNEVSEQMRSKFMPFGLGRRACPGEGLAMRMVGLALASLLQCFDWERPGKELIDMGVHTGLSIPKVQPLQAKCRPRDTMAELISQL